MSVQVEITGATKVVADLGQFSDKSQKSLRKAISRIVIKLQALVKVKLSDDVLNVKSGRLRRSINQQVKTGTQTIEGSVGTNVVYAAAHELGFHGTVTVSEHLRFQRLAWGKEMKDPHYVTVSAHPMKMNLPERSFLRSALREQGDDIDTNLNSAVQEAIDGRD